MVLFTLNRKKSLRLQKNKKSTKQFQAIKPIIVAFHADNNFFSGFLFCYNMVQPVRSNKKGLAGDLMAMHKFKLHLVTSDRVYTEDL